MRDSKVRKGKGIVDIGNIDTGYIENELDILNKGDAHNILPGRHCPEMHHFQIYHYTGNEEQRTARDGIDPRGAFANPTFRWTLDPDQCSGIPATDLRPWLKGFVEAVGQDEAKRLLEGAGRVNSWPLYEHTTTLE